MHIHVYIYSFFFSLLATSIEQAVEPTRSMFPPSDTSRAAASYTRARKSVSKPVIERHFQHCPLSVDWSKRGRSRESSPKTSRFCLRLHSRDRGEEASAPNLRLDCASAGSPEQGAIACGATLGSCKIQRLSTFSWPSHLHLPGEAPPVCSSGPSSPRYSLQDAGSSYSIR